LSLGSGFTNPYFFSPSGTELVFRSGGNPGTGDDIGMITIGGDADPVWLLRESYLERNAELSPDGRWMAYQSDESGQWEIYVRPFPNVDEDRVLVSNAGGEQPLWSRDGEELFYLEPGPPVRLMSVSIEAAATGFSFSTRTPILDWPYRFIGPPGRKYDVSLDGQQFLALRERGSGEATPQIIVVQNWFEEVRRLAPAAE
jgi:serine/threonine-protein kinase